MSEFAGGFPNEIMVYEQYQNDSLSELKLQFYIYFVLIVILAIASMAF